MKERIIIIGSSGHAKIVIDTIEKGNTYDIVGLIDDYREIEEKILGYSIIGEISDLKVLVKKYSVNYIFIAIGDNFRRNKVYDLILQMGIKTPFANVIHPTSIISKSLDNNKGIL